MCLFTFAWITVAPNFALQSANKKKSTHPSQPDCMSCAADGVARPWSGQLAFEFSICGAFARRAQGVKGCRLIGQTEAWRKENAKIEWREGSGRAMIICFSSVEGRRFTPLVTSSLRTMTAFSVADISLVFTLVYASRSITIRGCLERSYPDFHTAGSSSVPCVLSQRSHPGPASSPGGQLL